MSILSGKKGLILGVANKWSIAWGIAEACHKQGAELIFSYHERVKERVEKLAAELENVKIVQCDVTKDEELKSSFEYISEAFDGELDFVVHSLAFAKREELGGRFVDISREGYALAQDVSAYSLIATAKHAEPLLKKGASIVTLTYLGGERVVENYNVMGAAKASLDCCVKYLAHDLGEKGIRVNAISAGPIKTLAASAVSGINTIIERIADVSPLHKNVTPEEVGDVAAFLVSDLSRAITGETVHVDSGFHVIGAVEGAT